MTTHWVYRYHGDYAGLVEDMNKIVRHDPRTRVINVQLISGRFPDMEFLIFTRKELEG